MRAHHPLAAPFARCDARHVWVKIGIARDNPGSNCKGRCELSTTVLVGNPKPGSRTRQVAEAAATALSDTQDHTVIDLADHGVNLLDPSSAVASNLRETVAASKLLIVASPTYKATYTGLLKLFLDGYGSDGLRGVTAVPVMTGASDAHGMAPDVFLRPLLVELGASVPTQALYYVTNDMDALDERVNAWATKQEVTR
jgi:FMN reductase